MQNYYILTANLQVQFVAYSSTGSYLKITPPENNDNVNYVCNITSEDKKYSEKKTSKFNITLDTLTPNTTYNVRCLTREDDKELCYAGIANGRTFPSGEYIYIELQACTLFMCSMVKGTKLTDNNCI